MTTTTELHAAIAQMQVLIGQAADRIAHFADELAKSHTVDGIVKDLDVQLMLESDADLIDHLRAAALPWDQRHKPDPYASEAETQALLVPDTRTAAERNLAQMMAERGADEQGAEAYPILRQIALELLAEQPAQQEPVACERCLELERLCDATYVAQGADAYNHACDEMERWQHQRRKAGKEVGTTGSLCDGISWLYGYIDELEAKTAQRRWVGLTAEEIDTIYREIPPPVKHWKLSRAIEAKLKEKNNGN